jgi:hypothetical protein
MMPLGKNARLRAARRAAWGISAKQRAGVNRPKRMGVCSRSRLGRRSVLSRSARATRREQKPRSARATQARVPITRSDLLRKMWLCLLRQTIRQLGTGRQLKDFIYYRCSGSDAYRFGGERICSNSQVQGRIPGDDGVARSFQSSHEP